MSRDRPGAPGVTTAVTPAGPTAAPDGRRGDLRHVAEFDGLRAYLAWWVVAFHLYQRSGLAGLKLRSLDLALGQGWSAVPVFFTLSGLVIALTDDARREGYLAFLARRFFRLAPAYYLVLAVAVADAARTGAYGRSLPAHAALHALMLHGLVPDEALPDAPHALEPVTWSVSVEWQFYLVAPLALGLARRSAAGALAALAAAGAGAYALDHAPWTFAERATVVARAGPFALGVGSYFLFRYALDRRAAGRPLAAYALPFGAAAAWSCGGPLVGPGPVWAVVFPAVLAYHAGAENPLTRPVRAALGHPAAVRLGRISYSTYLCHDRVLALADAALAAAGARPGPWARFAALAAVGVPLVVATSAALYYLVERPGVALGKRLAARLGPP